MFSISLMKSFIERIQNNYDSICRVHTEIKYKKEKRIVAQYLSSIFESIDSNMSNMLNISDTAPTIMGSSTIFGMN